MLSKRIELLVQALRRDGLSMLERKKVSNRALTVLVLDTLEVLRLIAEDGDDPLAGLHVAKVSGSDLKKLVEGETSKVDGEAPKGAYL